MSLQGQSRHFEDPNEALEAVEGAFGIDIDYAMLVKIYEPSGEGEKRYSPARFSFSEPAGTPQ